LRLVSACRVAGRGIQAAPLSDEVRQKVNSRFGGSADFLLAVVQSIAEFCRNLNHTTKKNP
jgi:hypothetical protein